MPHCLIVSGAAACFVRPGMGFDQVTYDVITPIAARGIFEAVHWTPAIAWRIQRIEVLSPIVTRWRDRSDGGRTLELADVRYAISARFDLTPSAGARDNGPQHVKMFKTRARRQQFFRLPYLGRCDLLATVELADADTTRPSFYAGSGIVDLGWMLHDRDFLGDHRLRFYHPLMIDGVVDCDVDDPGHLTA